MSPSRRSLFFKSFLSVLTRLLISTAVLGGSIAAFVYLNATRANPVPQNSESPHQIVQTEFVQQSNEGIDFEVDGIVIPYKRIAVPVEVDGVVAKRSDNCRIGRYVEKGEALVEIDTTDYQLEIRRLRGTFNRQKQTLKATGTDDLSPADSKTAQR